MVFRIAVLLSCFFAIWFSGETIAQEFRIGDTPPAANALLPTTDQNQTTLSTNNRAFHEATSVGQPDSPKPVDAGKKQKKLAKAVATAHKLGFFDNDFSYLHDPAYDQWWPGDALKQRGDRFSQATLDIGGQYRIRGHFERNHRGLGVTGVDDDFLLHRVRLYGDLKLTPYFRVYGEYIDAESNLENNPPRPIEVNRSDLLNLFVEWQLPIQRNDSTLSLRVGRQELYFGSHRLVSNLDWANTRRNFEGFRFLWRGKNWDIDGFWTNPVAINPVSFDAPNRDQEFSGVFSTYKGLKDSKLEAYYFRFLNGAGANDFQFDTPGFRWIGDRDGFLWEIESAIQFGRNTDGSDHLAAMATVGLGRHFKETTWKPKLWFYYDWASGDDDLAAGNGFNQLFPLAHKYLGFIDLFGRSNIEDANVQLSLHPCENVKFLVWYHYLFLATQSDSPYTVISTPINGGNAPGSVDLGHEIDFLCNWKVNPRTNITLGYSRFFSGDFFSTTPGTAFDGDVDFFYSQFTVNF